MNENYMANGGCGHAHILLAAGYGIREGGAKIGLPLLTLYVPVLILGAL